jgi:hypothetical protein
MSEPEVKAFNHVAQQCHEDVQYFCTVPSWSLPFVSRSSLQLHSGADEFANVMNVLYDAAIHMPFLFATTGTIILLESPITTIHMEPADHIISHLAAQTSPEDLADVTLRVQEHASNVLLTSENEETSRVARRLQSITPQDVMVLPFGEHNACLQQVFGARMVGTRCGQALVLLQSVRAQSQQDAADAADAALKAKKETHAKTLVWLAVCLFVLNWIFMLYLSPAEFRRALGTFLALVCTILVVGVVAPMLLVPYMFGMVLAMGVEVVRLCFRLRSKTAARVCCCCDGSVENVVDGLKSCCSCCHGSDVCLPVCASCASHSGCDGACTCKSQKETIKKIVVYEGVPIQIV